MIIIIASRICLIPLKRKNMGKKKEKKKKKNLEKKIGKTKKKCCAKFKKKGKCCSKCPIALKIQQKIEKSAA